MRSPPFQMVVILPICVGAGMGRAGVVGACSKRADRAAPMPLRVYRRSWGGYGPAVRVFLWTLADWDAIEKVLARRA